MNAIFDIPGKSGKTRTFLNQVVNPMLPAIRKMGIAMTVIAIDW